MHYSIGWDLGERERRAIGHVPVGAWGVVLDTEGHPRPTTEAGVVELTAVLREHPDGDHLSGWPPDLRIICRREKPHPGAQLSLFEERDGWRYPLVATNTPRAAPCSSSMPATARTPVSRTPCVRASRPVLVTCPRPRPTSNRAWCLTATIADDLLCWLRLLCLDGPLAKAEPNTLRCIPPPASFSANANARSAAPETWPWATQLHACYQAIFALPWPG
ncbi:hypothetical protein [Amycolatopsis palatopharyngis]|uniref:hypothetical protein n=1 Tax=Amycolatopsis palatopharyngis TaxID=187982 RepID=UPI000E27B465|nr:hypothetical protein [Amycolatopsis palatopharyngis]